jgi:glutamyl/glutaminyl-tRNA synthetase
MSTLDEFWTLCGWAFDGPVDDPKARAKWLDEEGLARLREVRAALGEIGEPWTAAAIEGPLNEVVERSGVKPGKVFQPLRVAITGTTVSPGIFESVALLGREETLARLEVALNTD